MNIKVLQELKEYWNDAQLLRGQVNLILSPVHEMHEQYNELLFTYRQRVFTIGYNQGVKLTKARQSGIVLKSEDKKTIKIHNTKEDIFGTLSDVEQRLRDDTFVATEHTLSRVDQSITELLEQGYREGVGIDQVAKNIKNRFDQLRTWEAKRIARTEIHTAHSMGRNQSYQDLGVQYTEWISAHDKRVRGNRKSDRANHIIMDGEIKPINATYSNGLKYPGDKSGKIEEWINCRCKEAPYIMPPGVSAPPGMTNFKEKDLINVAEPNYNTLIEEATGGVLNMETYMESLRNPQILQETLAKTKVVEEEEYEETSAEFAKWIDYIREGNWRDPDAMLEKIDRLGERKTNKLTQEEIESLQLEAQDYVMKERQRFEELEWKIEELEEQLEYEYPVGTLMHDKLKKELQEKRKEYKKMEKYF